MKIFSNVKIFILDAVENCKNDQDIAESTDVTSVTFKVNHLGQTMFFSVVASDAKNNTRLLLQAQRKGRYRHLLQDAEVLYLPVAQGQLS